MDPGLTDLFAAYAHRHLFDEIDEVHVRDGGDLYIEGYAFAPVFSIWTTIEECLNPPLIWDVSRGGHYTTEPFSAPEAFVFPEGIGPVECVNVEHEEVVLVPYGIPGVKKATFKYALGADFINVLKVLHAVGLDSTKPVTVKGMQVAPRDLVMAVTPDPARVGERMKGRAIVGTWVIGRKDGAPREVYLYQKTVGEESWADFGLQAVGWQTGFNPVLGLELLARGEWGGAGVYVPEQLDPDPYMAALDRWGIHWAIEEREPGANVPT
jgi:saccharopine dehydrogenase-like NADP-dependent oxidoreductase